jgi:hypothetical protein
MEKLEVFKFSWFIFVSPELIISGSNYSIRPGDWSFLQWHTQITLHCYLLPNMITYTDTLNYKPFAQ